MTVTIKGSSIASAPPVPAKLEPVAPAEGDVSAALQAPARLPAPSQSFPQESLPQEL